MNHSHANLGRGVRVRSDAIFREARPHRSQYGQIDDYRTDEPTQRIYYEVHLEDGTIINAWPDELDLVR